MRSRFIPLLLALSPASLAQTWSKLIEHSDWNAPEALTTTTEGLVVVASVRAAGWDTTLTWFDASGAVVLQQDLDVVVRDLSPRADGGVHLVGAIRDLGPRWAGSMDAGGSWLWQWKGTLDSQALRWSELVAVETTPDGGLVATGWRGYEGDYGFFYPEACLYMFDAGGNLLWDRRFGDAFQSFELATGRGVAVLESGDIAVAAVEYPDLIVALLDASGAVQWQRRVEVHSSRPSITATSDGRLAVVPGQASNDNTVLLFEADGSLAWQRNTPGPGTETSKAIAGTPDGGLVITGVTSELGDLQPSHLTMRLSSEGEVVWRKVSGLAQVHDWGVDVDVSSQGLVRTLAFYALDTWVMSLEGDATIDGCELLTYMRTSQATNYAISDEFEVWPPIGDTSVSVSRSATPGAWPVSNACLGGGLGEAYCDPAIANSSGFAAVVSARGSAALADNDVTLVAYQLPANQVGMFVTGMSSGTVTPPGAQGQLCISGGPIHRYVAGVQSAGSNGSISLSLDLTAVPGHGAIQAGETWNYQAWYRDHNPGSTSNFTDALAIGY